MQQKQLTTPTYNKQYVSKVVNRRFRIPDVLVKEWERVLHVPSRYFIDDEGLCKELSPFDVQELNSYLNAQFFIENEEELYAFPETQRALREHDLSTNITKLQRKLRKDIYTVRNEADSMEAALYEQECNLHFYQDVLELRQSNCLSGDEWERLFQALYYLGEDMDETVIEKAHILVYCIYTLIKKYRELDMLKRHRDYLELKDVFDFCVDKLETHFEQ